MRPRGEIRDVLASAARTLLQQHGQPVTWRDLAVQAQVGFTAARDTVRNMARAGDLRLVGTVRRPGACRPMASYVPVTAGDCHPDAAGLETLVTLMRTWTHGPG